MDKRSIFGVSSSLKGLTKGLWMCREPFLKKMEDGTEIAVILIDSEGLDSLEENQSELLFVLTILISSVLIYNCKSITKPESSTKLRYFGTLASKIQVNKDRYKDKTALEEDKADSKDFFRFFPDIFWLLRDITFPLTIETKGEVKEVETKDYILLEILNTGESSHKKRHLTEQMKLKKAIIDYFPTFDALKLPIPSSHPNVLMELNDMKCLENSKDVNPEFVRGIKTLRNTLNRKMKPKKAWPQVGNMYGPQLAKFLQTCVKTINSQSTVPCIQMVWEDVITSLLDAVVNNASTLYETEMGALLSSEETFNEIDILRKHEVAVCKATDLYNDETRHINDARLRQKCFRKLQDVIVAFEKDTSAVTGGMLARYIFDNEDASGRFCRNVANNVLMNITRLRDESFGSFENIQEVLTVTIGDYIRGARGPKKVQVLQEYLLKEVRKVVFDKNFLKRIAVSEKGFLAKVRKSHSFEERHEEKMRKRMEDLLKQGAYTLEQWYRTNKTEEENLRHERSRLTRSARRREERAWDTYFDTQKRQQRIDHEEMQNKIEERMINIKKIYDYNTELLQKEVKERETDIHTLRENKRKTRGRDYSIFYAKKNEDQAEGNKVKKNEEQAIVEKGATALSLNQSPSAYVASGEVPMNQMMMNPMMGVLQMFAIRDENMRQDTKEREEKNFERYMSIMTKKDEMLERSEIRHDKSIKEAEKRHTDAFLDVTRMNKEQAEKHGAEILAIHEESKEKEKALLDLHKGEMQVQKERLMEVQAERDEEDAVHREREETLKQAIADKDKALVREESKRREAEEDIRRRQRSTWYNLWN